MGKSCYTKQLAHEKSWNRNPGVLLYCWFLAHPISCRCCDQVHVRQQSSRPPKWQSEHEKFIAKYKLHLSQSWSAEHGALALGERERQVIDLTWCFHKAHGIDENELSTNDLLVDISQSLSRCPWTRGSVRSMTGNSRYFSFAGNKMLNVADHFALMGFSKVVLTQVTKNQGFERCAQAMSQPCVALVALAVLSQTTLPMT